MTLDHLLAQHSKCYESLLLPQPTYKHLLAPHRV